MKNVALTLCTYDGILSHYCGVGTTAKNTVNIFNNVKQKIEKKYNIQLAFNIITPLISPKCIGYRKDLYFNSLSICKQNNGDIYYISDGSSGNNQYGILTNWEATSISCASVLLNLQQKYDKVIAILDDTPFMKAGIIASRQLTNNELIQDNLTTVWISHSTSKIHIKAGINPEPNVLKWEEASLSAFNQNQNIKVGHVSMFMATHLQEEYGLKSNKLMPIISGLTPGSILQAYPKGNIKKILTKFNIPLDKKIFVTWGRAEYYKGFESILPAFESLGKDYFLVMQASPYRDTDIYPLKLKKLWDKHKIEGKIIFKFERDLINALLLWKNTVAVIVPSLSEPLGLIPEETRGYVKDGIGPFPIVHDIDGLSEQVTDGVDGFKYSNLIQLKNILFASLSMTETERLTLTKNGYEKLKINYNFETNFTMFLDKLVKEII